MVTRSSHGLRCVLKHSLAVMLNTAGFAVHQLMSSDHVTAKSGANRLMSKAYAQQGPFAGEVLDQINADARFLRRAGTRRNKDVIGTHGFNVRRRNLIVSPDLH